MFLSFDGLNNSASARANYTASVKLVRAHRDYGRQRLLTGNFSTASGRIEVMDSVEPDQNPFATFTTHTSKFQKVRK